VCNRLVRKHQLSEFSSLPFCVILRSGLDSAARVYRDTNEAQQARQDTRLFLLRDHRRTSPTRTAWRQECSGHKAVTKMFWTFVKLSFARLGPAKNVAMSSIFTIKASKLLRSSFLLKNSIPQNYRYCIVVVTASTTRLSR
jgi:hypothetical protein